MLTKAVFPLHMETLRNAMVSDGTPRCEVYIPVGASLINTQLFLSGRKSLEKTFLCFCECEYMFDDTVSTRHRVALNNESHWLPTYSSLDSVKCVMGYTQRFTTIERQVAPRSAWVRSLWSRLSFFSLCAVLFLTYTSLKTCLAASASFVFTPQT